MKLFFSSQGMCSQQSVLVLGTFDGVHLGHQQLLKKGRDLANKLHAALVFSTFFPHPLRIIRPQKAPKEITTVLERASVLSKMGVDEMLVWKFSKDIQSLSPQEFILKIVLPLKPKAVVIGFNYTFGKNGQGTADLMRDYGESFGFDVVEVPPVTIDGQVVSSTRIRNFLCAGQVKKAQILLSRPYSVQGKIVHGKKAGGKLGFATANMLPHSNKVLLAFGVYTAYVTIQKGLYPAIVNIGNQPTLPSGHVTIEAHLLNQNINLYDEKARIFFLEHLRDEIAFESVQALQRQVGDDIQRAKKFFNQPRI